jgi:hypothetical protein
MFLNSGSLEAWKIGRLTNLPDFHPPKAITEFDRQKPLGINPEGEGNNGCAAR